MVILLSHCYSILKVLRFLSIFIHNMCSYRTLDCGVRVNNICCRLKLFCSIVTIVARTIIAVALRLLTTYIDCDRRHAFGWQSRRPYAMLVNARSLNALTPVLFGKALTLWYNGGVMCCVVTARCRKRLSFLRHQPKRSVQYHRGGDVSKWIRWNLILFDK